MYALLIVVLLEGGESVVQADPLLHDSYRSCISSAAKAMNIVVEIVPESIKYWAYHKCVEIPTGV